MTILTEKTIYLTENFFNFTTFVIIIGIAACIEVIVAIYLMRPKVNIKFSIFERIVLTFLMVLFFLVFASLIGIIASQRVETIAERTEYEVYLEDMTYNELAESPDYTIVSTEGKKIIIVDKEWRYYEGYEK